jgi:hypothetical protein
MVRIWIALLHHKEHQAEMLGAFSFVFSKSKKTSA